MSNNDIWIAATASALNATLLTTDRDFDHLNNLFLSVSYIDRHLNDNVLFLENSIARRIAPLIEVSTHFPQGVFNPDIARDHESCRGTEFYSERMNYYGQS